MEEDPIKKYWKDKPCLIEEKTCPLLERKKKEYKKQFKCTCILDPPQGSTLNYTTSLLYAHAQILIKQMSF
jgi:hypothetical protein